MNYIIRGVVNIQKSRRVIIALICSELKSRDALRMRRPPPTLAVLKDQLLDLRKAEKSKNLKDVITVLGYMYMAIITCLWKGNHDAIEIWLSINEHGSIPAGVTFEDWLNTWETRAEVKNIYCVLNSVASELEYYSNSKELASYVLDAIVDSWISNTSPDGNIKNIIKFINRR